MKFFFADSLDLVDPTFDFQTETRSEVRVRQRDDAYPHEILSPPPYDGILVSKAIVDGHGDRGGKYTVAQRHRFLRSGVRSFFRITNRSLETIGDCGAFSYVQEERPPYSVDEVLEFYQSAGFDYGISVDHIILQYQAEFDMPLKGLDPVPPKWRARQEITLKLAKEFYRKAKRIDGLTPIGVAQGWSPLSYTESVRRLQAIGYDYIALGGVVPLKTDQILACLKQIETVRKSRTRLHLLGVTRCESISEFRSFGVASFDSTSPLRQAFKDDTDNFYTLDRTYCAVRVPQVEGNAKLGKRIRAGEVNQDGARRLERACLDVLTRFDRGEASLLEAAGAVEEYEFFLSGSRERAEAYREVLRDQPWKQCDCDVCRKIGIHVILFRGAERNRRRGFHNLHVFRKRLQLELSRTSSRTERASNKPMRIGSGNGKQA